MNQMDLFDTQSFANLREEIEKINKSTAAVRRGLFARNTALEKYMAEMQSQVERLEREVYNLRLQIANPDADCQIHEFERVM